MITIKVLSLSKILNLGLVKSIVKLLTQVQAQNLKLAMQKMVVQYTLMTDTCLSKVAQLVQKIMDSKLQKRVVQFIKHITLLAFSNCVLIAISTIVTPQVVVAYILREERLSLTPMPAYMTAQQLMAAECI